MRIKILDVGYDNVEVGEAVQNALALLEREDRKADIFFLNLECLRLALEDAEYRKILEAAALVLPDGVALSLATRWYGGRMKENCNGTDLMPLILRAAAEKGKKVFFFGAREGVASEAARKLTAEIPSLQIVGSAPGYFQNHEEMIRKINASGADILVTGMGTPLQEKWIAQHRQALSPQLCIGAGALFDWLSCRLQRAPQWIRALSLEWLWRIFIEPRRMVKRYLIDGVPFFLKIIFCRFSRRG